MSRRRLAILVVPVLIFGLAVLGLEWRHPTDLAGAPPGGTTITTANRVGQTVFIDLVPLPDLGDRHSMTIHSVQPLVRETIPGAAVKVLLCRQSSVGAVRGLDKYCKFVQDPAGANVMVGRGTSNDLVVRIHSDHPGRVVVNGAEVSYSSGWRDGSSITGIRAVATFARCRDAHRSSRASNPPDCP
jgi:hypothetical protein